MTRNILFATYHIAMHEKGDRAIPYILTPAKPLNIHCTVPVLCYVAAPATHTNAPNTSSPSHSIPAATARLHLTTSPCKPVPLQPCTYPTTARSLRTPDTVLEKQQQRQPTSQPTSHPSRYLHCDSFLRRTVHLPIISHAHAESLRPCPRKTTPLPPASNLPPLPPPPPPPYVFITFMPCCIPLMVLYCNITTHLHITPNVSLLQP